jgi:hypothetical protein
MPTPKAIFKFSADDAVVSTLSSEAKTLRVLEFIAHYLDRIDGHLEALATHAPQSNANTAKIALEVSGIAHMVGRIASKP